MIDYRELLIALLMRAIDDYQTEGNRKETKDYFPAHKFFFTFYPKNDNPGLSFENICHYLGISKWQARRKLLKMKRRKK
jgi:hypothetical protein